jgi:hypothetical protein
MMIRRIAFILGLVITMTGTAAARQTGGQLCVRSFEDRNANGKLDAGEPLLTRGISVNLLDAGGITVASALLDESPTAAQGVVCFQFLAAGQYSVVVTSADITATTPSTVTTTIADGSLPTVVEFGGQRAAVPTPSGGTSSAPALVDQSAELGRIVVAALGALVVVGAMVFLGFIVYTLAFRGRRPTPAAALDPRTTGSTPPVHIHDTGEHPRV